MVTEAVTGRARTESAIPYGARLLLTLFLLALYWFAHQVPLPFVDRSAVLELSNAYHVPGTVESAGILALGIVPLVTGFFLVEIFALVTTPGRRLRKGGTAGRAKLNRAALIVSLAVSAVQAIGISLFLKSASSPGGAPLLSYQGWLATPALVLTLAAVTAALFALGVFLSEYGIGNGFALLLLTNTILPILGDGLRLGFSDPTIEGLGLLLALVLAVLLIRRFRQADARGIPAFPQSLVPGQLAFLLWPFLKLLGVLSPAWDLRAVQPAVVAVAVALFSWLTFHLFSSRPRLAADLPETDEVLDGMAETLRRHFLPATGLLVLGTATFLAWGNFEPTTLTALLAFQPLVIILAIAFDLWDQFLFTRRHRATARLIQLDNVYFAYRLVTLLKEQEIDALARGHHFRALFFFLVPLFKIDVLVPAEDLDHARKVLAELEAAREVKVF
jgi:SecY translocase/putative signal transducing protein